MSNHQCKRNGSPSCSRTNKRASRKNRSKNYDRRSDSYERHHHPMQSNGQYNYRYPSDSMASLDATRRNVEEHLPIVETVVQELLFERKRRQIIEEKLNMREHDYALLHAQHEQIINKMKLLKHDYDQCRVALEASRIEVNELRHSNHQLRTHIDHQFNDEREHINHNEEIFYQKRQRRY